ncbi:MAG: tRNA threonylcarbamoyladenosine dehydratase [Verrucomicrobiales bacterium]
MSPDYLSRFSGIARLYGQPALARFARSRVLVIGLGGVGSWAVEALARSGVGQLSLVDLDDLCLTNTNRQIHALSSTIGQNKARTLAERVLAINPEAKVTTHERFYTEKNGEELLAESRPDLVIDAIDAVRPKCHLLASCHRQKIPVITSGAAGGRIDPTRLCIDDLSRTHDDALLASVRKNLRAHYGFPKAEKKSRKFGLPAIFSPEAPKFPQCDGSVSSERPDELPAGLKCDAGYGSVTHLTATFGNCAAAWALDQLAARA